MTQGALSKGVPLDRTFFPPIPREGAWGYRVTQEFDLGVHHFLRQEWRQAANALREVLQEDPHHARAWSYLGITLAHMGQAPQAENALSRAIELAPADGEAWFHLGVARALREEWDEAADAYQRAVALLPEDMVAWHRLGVALTEAGEEDRAEVAFERALILSRETNEPFPSRMLPPSPPVDDHHAEAPEPEEPREADSWLKLALSLLSLGEEEAAMAAYERAYTIDADRAHRSLFRPMLHLVWAAGGGEVEEEEETPPPAPDPPPPKYLPSRRTGYRPEIA